MKRFFYALVSVTSLLAMLPLCAVANNLGFSFSGLDSSIVVPPCLNPPQVNLTALDVVGLPNDLVYCDGSSAYLDANATGGTMPYSFVWSTGAPNSVSFVANNPNLGFNTGIFSNYTGSFLATTVTVTVTDAAGCTGVSVLGIGVDRAFTVSVVATENSGSPNDNGVCFGDKIRFSAQTSGGGVQQTYLWSNSAGGQTSPLIEIQPPHADTSTVYYVSVTDNYGCLADTFASAKGFHQIVVDSIRGSFTCAGDYITMGIHGGTADNGQYITFLNGDNSGYFYVPGTAYPILQAVATSQVLSFQVVDQKGCTANASVTVYKPIPVEVCNNYDDDCDGTTDEGFDQNNNGIADCAEGCTSINGSDLVVPNAIITPTAATPGNFATIQATIKNIGTIKTSKYSVLRWYLSTDVTLSSNDYTESTWRMTYSKVLPGASQTKTKHFYVSANDIPLSGGLYLIIVADADAEIVESCENNNRIILPFSIADCQSDLEFDNKSSPSCAKPGSIIPLCATVENDGPTVSKPATVKFYFSLDNSLGNTDILLATEPVSPLGPNGKVQKCVNPMLPASIATPTDGYILFVIDGDDNICDVNMSNNRTSKSIKIRSSCSNFNLVATNSDTYTDLHWVAQSPDQSVGEIRVERATDNTNFETILTTKGFAATDETNYQHATDNEPRSGSNFYRLNILFEDGETMLTPPQQVVFVSSDELSLQPNPAENYTVINLQKWQGALVNIAVLDGLGQSVFSTNHLSEGQNSHYILHLDGFKSGFYTVRLSSAGKRSQAIKLVVVR